MEPKTNRVELAEAVNTLIEDGGAKQMFIQMQGVIELSRKNVPVALAGRPAVLNPLVRLAISDEPAFDRVLDLVERKRKEAGLDALQDFEADRKAYMREFMNTKRERQRRLIELLNTLRSEHDKIKGTARIELEREHASRWIDEKNRREAQARGDLGRRLTADERKNIASQLWQEVDVELGALEAFAQEEMRKPLSQRNKAEFKFLIGPPHQKEHLPR